MVASVGRERGCDFAPPLRSVGQHQPRSACNITRRFTGRARRPWMDQSSSCARAPVQSLVGLQSRSMSSYVGSSRAPKRPRPVCRRLAFAGSVLRHCATLLLRLRHRATLCPRAFFASAEPHRPTFATPGPNRPNCRRHGASAVAAPRRPTPLARRRLAVAQATCSPTRRFTGRALERWSKRSTSCARAPVQSLVGLQSRSMLSNGRSSRTPKRPPPVCHRHLSTHLPSATVRRCS